MSLYRTVEDVDTLVSGSEHRSLAPGLLNIEPTILHRTGGAETGDAREPRSRGLNSSPLRPQGDLLRERSKEQGRRGPFRRSIPRSNSPRLSCRRGNRSGFLHAIDAPIFLSLSLFEERALEFIALFWVGRGLLVLALCSQKSVLPRDNAVFAKYYRVRLDMAAWKAGGWMRRAPFLVKNGARQALREDGSSKVECR